MLHHNDSKKNAYCQEPRNVPRSFCAPASEGLSIIVRHCVSCAFNIFCRMTTVLLDVGHSTFDILCRLHSTFFVEWKGYQSWANTGTRGEAVLLQSKGRFYRRGAILAPQAAGCRLYFAASLIHPHFSYVIHAELLTS